MSFSKIPSVLGFVSIKPAVLSDTAAFSASIFTLPSSLDFISMSFIPFITVLAGLVPWLESGAMISSLCVSP